MHEYILNLQGDKLIEQLKNKKVREEFLLDSNHYPFIWTIQGLKDEIIYFLGHDYLKDIMNSSKGHDKFVAIITSCNDKVNDILLEDDIINYILSDKRLNNYLNYLNYKVGQAIIDFDIKYNKNHLDLLSRFQKEEQRKIFSEEYIYKLLQHKKLDSSIIKDLDGKVINKLITHKKFLDMFLDLSIDDINRLIYLHDLVIDEKLFNSKKLIDKYVSLETNIYRVYVNNLLKNNFEFSEIVEKYRKEKVDNDIHSITDFKLLEFSNPDKLSQSYIYRRFNYKKASRLSTLLKNKELDKLDEMLKDITKEEVIVMIIDTLFKDIPYNFLKNLKTIINYSLENNNYIPKNINIYKEILNFDKYNIESLVDFYDKYKDLDLSLEFYLDYRKAKNDSYNSLNESVIKLEKENSIYNSLLSKKYDRDVYYLNGEDFKLFIHSSSSANWNTNKTISISMISNLNTSYYNDHYEPVVYGFSNLKIENIMHVYNADSYTMQMNGTDKVSLITAPDNLAENTVGYNEILYKEYDNFKPDFIVCFDEIKQRDLQIAEKLNLKIVLINSKKYERNEDLEFINNNTYLNPSDIDTNSHYDIKEEIRRK